MIDGHTSLDRLPAIGNCRMKNASIVALMLAIGLLFQQPITRGVQPFATGRARDSTFAWQQTEKSLALLNSGAVVWQLNFADREGKPYFHPLRLPDGTETTALRPADHPWHLGLWWSWKFINGVNYWECDPKTGKSEGTTEVTRKQITTHPDNSARVEFGLSYHPPQQAPLMTEKRVLLIAAPDAQGNYWIDWQSTFTAGDKEVKLDRTPPSGHAGGAGWGGYAGLSLRFAAAAKQWTFAGSSGAKAQRLCAGNRPHGSTLPALSAALPSSTLRRTSGTRALGIQTNTCHISARRCCSTSHTYCRPGSR